MNRIVRQYRFKKDVKYGEYGETIIKGFLESQGMVFHSVNRDYRYDLKMFYPATNKFYTYEIKTDFYENTGNILIEFESRGKKTGITITEADYFLTFFYKQGEIWNISTDKLKFLINYLNPGFFKMSGDKGSNTKLFCFKKKRVKRFFKIHKI